MAGGQNMHTLTKVDVTVRGWAPGILRRSGAAAAGAALVLGLLATGAPAASATTSFTLYVNQSGTSITGCASAAKACKTIAEGITAASLLSGDDVTVDVAASKTHYDENLVFGDTSNPTLTIKGAGAATTTLDGTKDGNSDVVVSFGVVTISGLAIVNGVSGDPGGGVENGATLSLTDDSLTGDTGSYGGAIHNTGSLTLTGDTLSNDTGSEGGGALYNQGIATLDHDTFTSDSGYDGDAVFNNATVTGTGDTFSSDTGGEGGGALYNDTQTATLTDSTFSKDSSDYGGGAENYSGHVTLTGDTFSGDTASVYGGGIYNYTGTVVLTDGTVSGDKATSEGGGVFSEGVATLTDDTLASDSAPYGGAVMNYGTASVVDDTLWHDTSTTAGGAIDNEASATLTDDTFSGDSSVDGGGIASFRSLTIYDSIVDASPCYEPSLGDIVDGGRNVDSDSTCEFGTSSKVNSKTIGLATSLAPNGSKGPETLAIAPGSSAYDEVPKAACTVTTDERDLHRPGEIGQTSCDAGAYEFQSTVPSAAQHVAATPGNKLLSLHWSAPSSNGGLAITAYRAYCSKTHPVSIKGKASATVSGKVDSAKVPGLKNGTKYYCVVIAANAKGSSPPSATVSATPKS
jgi:hypothetical protein